MKAARIDRFGDRDVVAVRADAPEPVAESGRLLVEVHAASINPVDTAVHLGLMQQIGLPATLGADFAGIVKEPGDGVRHLKAGDRVYGQASVLTGASGAFAEFASVPAGQAARIPPKLSFAAAAALPLTGVSAIQVVYEHLRLRPGQKVLIHGGSGGIGTVAIQLARHIGAYVAATAIGEAVAYARGLGADEVIDFQKEDFRSLIKGYDAVFDTVGGETYRSSFEVLKRGGVIVSMLEQPDMDRASRCGVTAIAQRTEVTTERLNRLSELVTRGTIKVHIDRVLPLEQIREALLLRESGKVRGKVVIQIRAD